MKTHRAFYLLLTMMLRVHGYKNGTLFYNQLSPVSSQLCVPTFKISGGGETLSQSPRSLQIKYYSYFRRLLHCAAHLTLSKTIQYLLPHRALVLSMLCQLCVIYTAVPSQKDSRQPE